MNEPLKGKEKFVFIENQAETGIEGFVKLDVKSAVEWFKHGITILYDNCDFSQDDRDTVFNLINCAFEDVIENE